MKRKWGILSSDVRANQFCGGNQATDVILRSILYDEVSLGIWPTILSTDEFLGWDNIRCLFYEELNSLVIT